MVIAYIDVARARAATLLVGQSVTMLNSKRILFRGDIAAVAVIAWGS